jgi:hypothetical protein
MCKQACLSLCFLALFGCSGGTASTALSDTATLIYEDHKFEKEALDADAKKALEGLVITHKKIKWKEPHYRDGLKDEQRCYPVYSWGKERAGALLDHGFDCDAEGHVKRKKKWQRAIEQMVEVEAPSPDHKIVVRAGKVTGIVLAFELPFDLATCIDSTQSWITDRQGAENQKNCGRWMAPDIAKANSWRDKKIQVANDEKSEDAAELPVPLAEMIKWLEGLSDSDLVDLYRFRGPGKANALACINDRKSDFDRLGEASSLEFPLGECVALGEKVTSVLSGG